MEDNLRWVMVVMVPMFIIVHCDDDIFVTVYYDDGDDITIVKVYDDDEMVMVI